MALDTQICSRLRDVGALVHSRLVGGHSIRQRSRLVLWCLVWVVGLVVFQRTWQLVTVASTSRWHQHTQSQEAALETYRQEQFSVHLSDNSSSSDLELLEELVAPASSGSSLDGREELHLNESSGSSSSTPWDVVQTKEDNGETGIILSLFDAIIPMGISLIKELRCLENHELIQVYHCFPDELSRANRELLLQDDNLEIIDVCSEMLLDQKLKLDEAKDFRSWWLKPLALVHTRLRHVLMLDADAILFKDPAIVRELDAYKETGTMFFYDRVIDSKILFDSWYNGRQTLRTILEDFDYAAFNISDGFKPSKHLQSSFAYNSKTSYEMDSSMVFVDKAKARKAMQVLFHLITKTRHQTQFSHGDKEAFWIAFEIAHTNYTFSPWGVSVISSSSNDDMKNHPTTLCGNMAHWMPVDTPEPELLYVNGKALLEPFPLGVEETMKSRWNILFNTNPTHVTPRQPRRSIDHLVPPNGKSFPMECLVGMGSTPLEKAFHKHLLRRRMHFFGLKTGVHDVLEQCFYSSPPRL